MIVHIIKTTNFLTYYAFKNLQGRRQTANNMDSTGILRANMSNQQLINHEDYERSHVRTGVDGAVVDSSGSSSLSSSNTKLDGKEMTPSSRASTTSTAAADVRQIQSNPLTKRQIITVSILCFVNLINYMDRYTIAGKVLFTTSYRYSQIEFLGLLSKNHKSVSTSSLSTS